MRLLEIIEVWNYNEKPALICRKIIDIIAN